MALLAPFTDEHGKEVWINPTYVARLSPKDQAITWVWFSYGGGECDVAVQGEIRTVAASLNIAAGDE